jgi:methionyl-tRNA synthetase
MVLRFQAAWKHLHIDFDDFIRTTEPRHYRVAETVLLELWEKGDIYKGQYEGWYCIPDERFWTEKDLVDGNCPECGRRVNRLEEPNYFFRMGDHQDWLIDYITEHTEFIRPASRRNEVLGFLRNPLGDLCISRPVSRLNWGIPLPFDHEYVTYVWFDALLNYVTAAGHLVDDNRFRTLWPNALHLIGKDILTTHCVYWPTMLHAIGLPQPRAIVAHGWWALEGAKMSKSRGNVVKPLDLADIYGVDAFRYFLMRDMAIGRDAEFTEQRLASRYQADLADDFGNLLHRLTNMIGRYAEGSIPNAGAATEEESALRVRAESLIPEIGQLIDDLAVNEGLARIMDLVRDINRYLERSAPWTLAKRGDTERVYTVLYYATEALRLSSILLHPVLPERTSEVWRRLGWNTESPQDGLSWGVLQPSTPVVSGEPLFPRLDHDREVDGP